MASSSADKIPYGPDGIDFIKEFPAPGLRKAERHITGYNEEGKGVFIKDDHGDHHRLMGANQAVQNIIYTTKDNPVELNNDEDLKYARDNEPGLHVPNGSVVRLIDFGPGLESPMHRAMSIDYGVVIEGEFEFILDSGESRIMRPGDISVQRATPHKWKNITGGGTKPGRMVFILLDCKDVVVKGEKMTEFLGDLQQDYVGR